MSWFSIYGGYYNAHFFHHFGCTIYPFPVPRSCGSLRHRLCPLMYYCRCRILCNKLDSTICTATKEDSKTKNTWLKYMWYNKENTRNKLQKITQSHDIHVQVLLWRCRAKETPRLKRVKREEIRNPFIHSQCSIGSRQAMEHVQTVQWSYYKSLWYLEYR